eukprot:528357_1
MAWFSLVASFAILSSLVTSQTYTLNQTYQGQTFFDQFEFLQDQECVSSSFTNFLKNASQGLSMGVINVTDNTVYMGTDYKSTITNNAGRTGICIGTKTRYKNGLFILDASHMPFGCGVWPSWWQTDGNYAPKICEIDTIEGINLMNDDRSTVHTQTACDFKSNENTVNMTGKWDSTNCDDHSGSGGCTIEPQNPSSYGQGFNNIGGGVFAHENNPNIGSIRIWFWTHDKVPDDIKNKQPNPDTWGKPYAEYVFGSWCPASNFNTPKQLRFDIYFCGWAGNDFQQCQSSVTKGKTCVQWVSENPSYFKEAYWLINYMDVYQLN